MTQTKVPTAADEPFWRSLLFVPAISPRFVARAHTRGADAIAVDLEDSVPAKRKDAARSALPGIVDELFGHGIEVAIRINRPLRLAVDDIHAAVRPGVRMLILPKVASPEHINLLEEEIVDAEVRAGLTVGGIRLLPLIETPGAILRAPTIAAASPRIAALSLGVEDFETSTGMPSDPMGQLVAHQTVVLAARAAGVAPFGLLGSVADYTDLAAYRTLARASRRQGMVGAAAIHPAQVPILNEEFRPSADEIAHARRLVAAAAEAGGAAVQLAGRMIDTPMVERAETLLAVARRLESRDRR